jgi:hypothetical protein
MSAGSVHVYSATDEFASGRTFVPAGGHSALVLGGSFETAHLPLESGDLA